MGQVVERLGRVALRRLRHPHHQLPVTQSHAVGALAPLQNGVSLAQLAHRLGHLALIEQYGGDLDPDPGQQPLFLLRAIELLGHLHQRQRPVILPHLGVEQPLLGADPHQRLLGTQGAVVMGQLFEIPLGPLIEPHPPIGVGDLGQHLPRLAIQPQRLEALVRLDELHQPLRQLPLIGVHVATQAEDVRLLHPIAEPAGQHQRLLVVLLGLLHVAEHLLMKGAAGQQTCLGDPVLAGPGTGQFLVGKVHHGTVLVVPLGRHGPALQPHDAPLHVGG